MKIQYTGQEEDNNVMAPHSRSRSVSKSISRSRSKSRSPRHSRSKSRSPKRERSRSRSRSRSPVRRRRSYSRSVSRSRSRSPRRGRTSRSPMSNRKRHVGDRDAPPAGKCLGVFGLSFYTTEREVRDFFERYGAVQECKIVYDNGTGKSRGFAFLTMRTLTGAQDAKERLNGAELDGRRIRVDYSITQRPHTPTPGVYMGRPTQSSRGRRGGGGYSGRNSGGRYGYKRSMSRSRSRSRSPPSYRDRY